MSWFLSKWRQGVLGASLLAMAFLGCELLHAPILQFESEIRLRLAAILLLAIVPAGLCWLTRSVDHRSLLVPRSLQSALDGISDALMVIDYHGNICYANRTLHTLIGLPPEALLGKKAKSLPWTWRDEETGDPPSPEIPWLNAVREGRARTGRLLGLPGGQERSLILNALPIAEPGERPLGALISLGDMATLQKKNAELADLLVTVRDSAARIRKYNTDLEYLSTHDPVTGCYSRRTGIEVLERLWREALKGDMELSCLIADIDEFRAINERYGYRMADEILRDVAQSLSAEIGPGDFLCRYGGEEFLILMPRTSLDDASKAADRMRQAVSRQSLKDVSVKVSLGISSTALHSSSANLLLEQTEQALGAAKSRGRNLVARFDTLESAEERWTPSTVSAPSRSNIIPFPAVTSLLSALAYRDLPTAAHSRRVADLCLPLCQRSMSLSASCLLETAALLHDIGKVGIPDAILHKETPLLEDEWEAILAHEQIGVEIVRNAFGSAELIEILENYKRPFEEAAEHPIPLAARILAVADAYDSMISHQLYREAMSPAEAIAELRRCAGTQFDPEIVSQFVEFLFSTDRTCLPVVEVDCQVALMLGSELESLADAIDQQDLPSLHLFAGRIANVAQIHGIPEISAKALELELATAHESDLLGTLHSAGELLACCRATQSAYLRPSCKPEPARIMEYSRFSCPEIAAVESAVSRPFSFHSHHLRVAD